MIPNDETQPLPVMRPCKFCGELFDINATKRGAERMYCNPICKDRQRNKAGDTPSRNAKYYDAHKKPQKTNPCAGYPGHECGETIKAPRLRCEPCRIENEKTRKHAHDEKRAALLQKHTKVSGTPARKSGDWMSDILKKRTADGTCRYGVPARPDWLGDKITV